MDIISKERLIVVSLIMILIIVLVAPVIDGDVTGSNREVNSGPFVDTVVYSVITGQDQRVLAIQADEIDIIARTISPTHRETLQETEGVSLAWTLRNGYGHFTFNCQKYPFNISAFRRAFAYALNKTRITYDIFDGESQEHDSVVPYVSGWCIEDELPYNYYAAQVALGNQILDNEGFTPDTYLGWRNNPDGSYLNVTIYYPSEAPFIAGNTAQIGVDALNDLGIDAIAMALPFSNIISGVFNNMDFDMVFYAYDFQNDDVDWLADEFWGELANVPYENPCNFRNATFDSWRDQLLYGTTYEEVYEAAAAMQLILHENVPLVVAYQNIFMQAYRHDSLTGVIEDVVRGIEGTWTLRKVRNTQYPYDTVRIAIAEEPDSFNFYVESNSFAKTILAELWPSLYLRGPDLQPTMYLAENLITETHVDNPAVKSGRTRFTIDIVQNAKWNDGTPITAGDVVFTFKYLVESGAFGNPAGSGLANLVAVYAPSSYRAVLEFESETYWHFSKFAYQYIIPRHIFNDETGIGYEHWNLWEPDFLNQSLNYGSGPFKVSDYVAGEFLELEANPEFWYYPEEQGSNPAYLQLSHIIPRIREFGILTVFAFTGIVLTRRWSI